MKTFAGVMVLSLALPVMGQQVTPARPQPGIAVGATGGIGTPATGLTAPGRLTVPGRPTVGPPPVYMTPEQLQPPYPGPFVLSPDLFPLLPYPEVPPAPAAAQGRPGGLGVTITGGSSSPAPAAVSTNVTTAVTNPAPAVTNPPSANPAGEPITNTAPQLPPY
ncbi:MAG TPA: hypothetical protein VJ063_13335 [Verrucomicrobiae bacterium]|nr:hypothetical protein [Verrucomicrobiae bacterium]